MHLSTTPPPPPPPTFLPIFLPSMWRYFALSSSPDNAKIKKGFLCMTFRTGNDGNREKIKMYVCVPGLKYYYCRWHWSSKYILSNLILSHSVLFVSLSSKIQYVRILYCTALYLFVHSAALFFHSPFMYFLRFFLLLFALQFNCVVYWNDDAVHTMLSYVCQMH